ncbi:MAG: low molecular weight phosphatase family protein [Terriglobia bacterium]|nr:MAG: low molecular weight phosphatase family protein [Terriglobia bacterium]
MKRVLFVCIGNSCRSQMAEAFAAAYGLDVLVPASAGLMPAATVARDTLRAMEEKNLNLSAHFPKSLTNVSRIEFDLIVNMSGIPLPVKEDIAIREWLVPDPVGLTFEEHCAVRDQIETLVMGLILELRRGQKSASKQKA